MKPSSSKAVAGMNVTWLALSAEEESQQPPAGLYSWPHQSLNMKISKSHKHAWCSYLRYGNNHLPLISFLNLPCCFGDVFKETVSLDWEGNKAQSAIAEQKRVLLLQMSPNHMEFRITKCNSSTFYCAFVTIEDIISSQKCWLTKADNQQGDDAHSKPHWSHQIPECVSMDKGVVFPSFCWALQIMRRNLQPGKYFQNILGRLRGSIAQVV